MPEFEGGVTLKAMEQMEEALGSRFIYAIVPEKSGKQVIEERAREKAKALLEYTNKQIALEAREECAYFFRLK